MSGRPQAPSKIASASSQSRVVLSGSAVPVSLYVVAPAGASVKRNFSPGVSVSTLRSISSAGAVTSGPMPSPPITAIWKASLARGMAVSR